MPPDPPAAAACFDAHVVMCPPNLSVFRHLCSATDMYRRSGNFHVKIFRGVKFSRFVPSAKFL